MLRQGYLETRGSARAIETADQQIIYGFYCHLQCHALFKAGNQAPHKRRDTIKEVAKLFTIDAEVFYACADIKEGTDKLSGEEVDRRVFKKYLQEVRKDLQHQLMSL
ncbi:MAG: hypothetical protein MZU79_01685 [Anaerotruncus sp.]|nr:hypothetical protein [Anaerotruncus sp.]